MNIINIEHISKIFGEKVIFEDASFGIQQGDKIGIVGINKNAVSLEVSDRAVFVESNLFSSAFFQQNTGKDMPQYDILISNPPYIRSAEIENLMEEVRDHDPRLALDGHEDGLYFYRKIVSEGRAFLKENGWMLFEIGYDQGEAVKSLMRENGFFDVQIVKDLTGLDRVVLGRR